jgi:peptidoglycan/LPS O-acetylase OafA/YrhL
MRSRMTRSTGAVSGLLIILLGVWGALIPFVGPAFNYSFSPNTTWHYTTDRLWLDILPGALAVLAGGALLLAATRAAGILAGWLAMLAGAWLIVGPSVSLTWESGAGPIGRPLYGTTRQMLELVGYFYGLGALIVALAAFSIGRFVSRPALAEEATAVGPADRATAAPQATSHTAGTEEGRRRRFPLPRQGERADGGRPGSQL